MGSFFDFDFEFCLAKKSLEIGSGKGETETRFALERNIDKVCILEFGSEVKVISKIFGLPEIPDGNEDAPFWFEVFFDLFQDKQLVLFCWQVVKNSNAGNIVVLRKMFPDGFFGDIGF